ncbi:RNA polymerase II C-terminal domain phosphatase-like 4 [Physcomitrium patens]|uniref:RNA polymerase II C-terminal domain phosphatase-like n=1 Tax=Physcomitrium patens TaxID=3218 RepID=A0A2K1K442_PHYPA|nr:RNA polymerase II C-terminal domain phosphatase-like 4 isoform X1 [Physcomitrium patens]XP_024385584.1 RNA polymerase II C-terminal domain phosphatase-like 4 isoform X1 [Physcomitrium patens]PNR48544.1 hypothetical protein PHYPA_013021 [Physcomitrium patens]|eukprot:XP_024385583.1 RNA polymerase II C-terminal domain phosphatase-like 4 isoform X1 [Physcomitrella patens]
MTLDELQSQSQSPAPSPSPSSSSDDFAALLDAELLGDRQLSAELLKNGDLVLPEQDDGDNSSDLEEGTSENGSVEEDADSVVESEDHADDNHLDVESDMLAPEGLSSDDNRKRRRGAEAELPAGLELPSAPGEMVNSNKCPPHPGFIWDVCIRCGKRKSTAPSNDPVIDRVGLRYIHEGLEVSELEAARVRNAELRRVTGKQKLLLVVDLDHTMLNSARFSEVPAEERIYLSTTYLRPNSTNCSAATVGQQHGRVSSLHQLTKLGMWTKLRPFAHKFLEEASKLYEMYVYTMGEKIYAQAMAELLDPTGQLFGGRIISQTDSTKRHTKDLDVVLGAESAVVILDDTEAVWPNHRSNLILMERYHFFTSSCHQFRVRAPSLAQMHRDECEIDGTLATTLKTLQAIHHEFFNGHKGKSMKRRPPLELPDVRDVIRSIRGKLLSGCHIVFSRIFPTGLQNPEFHPFWQLAVELGARCSTVCDHTTTHVVALDRGTDKARWAKQHGISLVHPRWVEAASYLWKRPREKDFPVTDDASALISTTFSKNISVEPISIEANYAEVELANAMDADKKKIVSTIEKRSQDFGPIPPDSAVEGS